jgi:hypothetical protein
MYKLAYVSSFFFNARTCVLSLVVVSHCLWRCAGAAESCMHNKSCHVVYVHAPLFIYCFTIFVAVGKHKLCQFYTVHYVLFGFCLIP